MSSIIQNPTEISLVSASNEMLARRVVELTNERDNLTKKFEQQTSELKAVKAALQRRAIDNAELREKLTHLDNLFEVSKAQVEHLQQRLESEEKSCEQVIGQRDSYHDWADELASGIARFFGVDIGEHSSANNPWREALNSIPAQCLAEHNVRVIDSFDAFIEMVFPQEGVNFDTYAAALDMFREQLRQQV